MRRVSIDCRPTDSAGSTIGCVAPRACPHGAPVDCPDPVAGRLTNVDVPAVTRWSSGSHVLRRHGLLPFDGTELVADDREGEVECFRGHRLEVLVGCMP